MIEVPKILEGWLARLTPEAREVVLADMAKKKRQSEENLSKLRAEIGSWISPLDAENIQLARQDAEICGRCEGFPCPKTTCQFATRQVKIDLVNQQVELRAGNCKILRAQLKQKANERKFKRCGIPAQYVGKTFEDYQVTPENARAVKAAKWAIKNPDKGLFLYGMTGCGKTFLAAIIAQELLKEGKSVVFGDVPSLLDTLKGTFDKNSDATIEELMDELQKVDVLVLDDIGTEYPTDWAAERLYMVVNNRYNAGKPIIVTSNYSPRKLSERFKSNITGARIVSRLCQMCAVAENQEKDFRMREFN